MEDLRSGLEDFGCKLKDETILMKLNDIRIQHGLSIDDTVDEWVAFMENQQSPEVTEDVVYKFESKLCSTLEKSSSLVTPQRKDSNKFAVFSRQTLDSRKFEDDILGAYVNLEDEEAMVNEQAICKSPTGPRVAKSPIFGSEESTVPTPRPVTTPHKDSNIVASLGGKWEQHPSLPKCCVSWCGSTNVDHSSSFGYMHQMDHSKSTDFNYRLVELSDYILSQHNLDQGVGLDIPSQDTCVYVGRVLSEAADGRLNVMSCLLEGTRDTSQGCVVKLDLSSVTDASIFPGQVLVVEGTNIIGGHLKASKLYHECTPDVNGSKQQSTEFLMIMASGPFTTLDSLEYSPLKDLLEAVKQDRPSILILCGPFIDSRHPLIENWMRADEVSDTFFIDILLQVLLVAKEFSCQVVVLPSQYDVHHHHVYPQPAFSKVLVQKRLLEKGLTVGDCSFLHFFQDPCIIDVNGICVGVTSTDTLKHLAGQTCDISCQKDRMATLINHLYTQKSFYPLYPPHDSVNMDVDRCYTYAALQTRPDVLILPSEMKQFIKVLHGGLCVNPGVLTKGRVKGTFARLYFSGTESDMSSDRFQVQVLRL